MWPPLLLLTAALLAGRAQVDVPPLRANETVKFVRVGVLAKDGRERAIARWNATIGEYANCQLRGLALHAVAGCTPLESTEALLSNMPKAVRLHYELVPLSFEQLMPAVAGRDIEFLIANPYYFACAEKEIGATAALSLLNKRGAAGSVHRLDHFGGRVPVL